jgi:hypothetical protein
MTPPNRPSIGFSTGYQSGRPGGPTSSSAAAAANASLDEGAADGGPSWCQGARARPRARPRPDTKRIASIGTGGCPVGDRTTVGASSFRTAFARRHRPEGGRLAGHWSADGVVFGSFVRCSKGCPRRGGVVGSSRAQTRPKIERVVPRCPHAVLRLAGVEAAAQGCPPARFGAGAFLAPCPIPLPR